MKKAIKTVLSIIAALAALFLIVCIVCTIIFWPEDGNGDTTGNNVQPTLSSQMEETQINSEATSQGETEQPNTTELETTVPVITEPMQTETQPQTVPPEQNEPLDVTLLPVAYGNLKKPNFEIKTNLPDGTVLSLELCNREYTYAEQMTATVENGVAQSTQFAKNEKELDGEYEFYIAVFPAEQPEKVKQIIGENGENLQGNTTEEMETVRYISVMFSYDTKTGELIRTDDMESEAVTEEEMEELLMELLTQSMGENVKIHLTGSVYTICLWQDGLALTSVLAVAGDPEAVAIWEDLRGTTAQLSISLCEFLAMNGHDDKFVTISLMNDVNMDNTLMEATLGVVTYDCTK